MDEAGAVIERGIKTIRKLFTSAINAPDEKTTTAIAKHAIASQKAERIRAMLFLSQSATPVSPAELDQDPYRLNCRNGTLDLRTGQLGQHRREDFVTKLVPIDYNPDATAPRWFQFLEQVFEGDQDLIQFVQRAAGYSLLGVQPEHVMLILHGGGRNGKGIFLETLRNVLGDDYARTAPVSMLLARDQEGIPNDLAGLKGTRLVMASEPNEGRRLDEGKIKALTGGDTMTARFMRGEFFDFRPGFTLWLSTNHRPVIRGTDEGIWSRLRLVPFGVRFYLPDEPMPEGLPDDCRADMKLADQLRKEYAGILTWMVKGCLNWQQLGSLGTPEKVRKATQAYREQEDVLGSFLRDCCALEPTASAAAKDLYQAYKDWTEASGERQISQIVLGKRLQEKGLDSAILGSGRSRYRAWLGIRLQDHIDRETV